MRNNKKELKKKNIKTSYECYTKQLTSPLNLIQNIITPKIETSYLNNILIDVINGLVLLLKSRMDTLDLEIFIKIKDKPYQITEQVSPNPLSPHSHKNKIESF